MDGAARPGAKILISGGSRCNVTNAVVSEADYWGGKRTMIRRVLSRLTVPETIAFFAELGVPLKEEPTGKLFPVSDRSRDVLDALIHGCHASGVRVTPSTRVYDVRRSGPGFLLTTSRGERTADRVVLATGGLSLPKTGSDGAGLALARRLGHTIIPTTPALAPLVLDEGAMHSSLAGVSHPVELVLRAATGGVQTRIRGPMLWTHFGISGPAALDLSRHVLRAKLEAQKASITISFFPGVSFETMEGRWLDAARERTRAVVSSVLAESLPSAVAAAVIRSVGIDPARRLADLSRDERRAVIRGSLEMSLPVRDSRGYNYAEATAGGVSLEEIDPRSMASRTCPGLFLVGEMLDVDGRLGGFNFQWAWASGRTAGLAIGRADP